MRREIVPIVEGDGDAKAVRVLLDRLFAETGRQADWAVGTPIRAKSRGNLTKADGLERFVEVARRRHPGAIMVLVDADKDCARDLARRLVERIDGADSRGSVVVVCPVRRYEQWLRAGLDQASPDLEFDGLGDPKGWIQANIPDANPYKPALHQAELTRQIDLPRAARCRSFRRLQHAIEQVIAAADQGSVVVTPVPSAD